ncbi:hypothetical protein [Williamsoniiplasma lucivorax]|uniref:Uncharacterized protein n=1 Tax=Williamsoniiplasma lucivorax TaxID=209274 RepID=A0A2S5REI6_9MOLU|nr:hypothetical protein [Williamsoniiplasma lucivorax]PPE05733.1 hypothetical protein ELUCI_v1c00190 [Williamsoniiplasma lucivorax]
MKKTILFLIPTLAITTLATQAISCNSKYQILSQDLSEWDKATIFQTNERLYQAIANGQPNVYLDDEKNSTPFLDDQGNYLTVNELVQKNWPGGANTPDQSSRYMNLKYLAPSMIAWYQKQTNKNAPLTNLQSITDNFEIGYNEGEVRYFGHPAALVYMQNKPPEYDQYLTQDAKPNKQKFANTFLGRLKRVNQSGSASEVIQSLLNMQIFIKQDGGRTITKEINGKKYDLKVSKDGYYSSILDQNDQPTNGLLDIHLGFIFAMSVF